MQDLAAVLGAEVLVSNDADGFKTAADESGLLQQVGKARVRRNTETWGAAITPALAAIGAPAAQAVADSQDLLRLMHERQPRPEASATLEASHRR